VSERIESVQALRGIAVLMVCAIHFLGTHNAGPLPEILRDIAVHVFHGVPVFFVISGFVLPLAMSRAAYRISDFPRFVLKRALRLEPPYLVSIALALILGVAGSMTPGFGGPRFSIDWFGLLAHVGYIVPFVGKDWIVGVYWTLLIQAQFYLLIGLTYPLLRRWPMAWTLTLLVPCALATGWNSLAYHLPIFLIGTAAFAWREKWITPGQVAMLWIVTTIVLSSYQGPGPGILALLAAAFILWAHPKSRALLFIGTISYSLYLVHLPIGRRAISLVLRFLPGTSGALAAAGIALALAIVAAWLMWRFVERPSLAWAGRVLPAVTKPEKDARDQPTRISDEFASR